MRKYITGALYAGLIILLLCGLSACASRTQQVRHLASDLSLLPPGTGEREVRVVLGPPDRSRPAPDGGEEWLYLEKHQSTMRRTRVVGNWLGHEDFHMAVITIRDGQLVDSIYRRLTEEEFLEFGGQPAASP